MPFPSLRGALLSALLLTLLPASLALRPAAASAEEPLAATGPDAPVAADAAAVAAVLDAFHAAAARADEAAYFALLAEDAVFLGTDATERWPKAAFREYAHPHFAAGRGWRFDPGTRQIALSADGRVAWFDELLASESYGECRGSGVLERLDGRWLIRQYHLTIPIPNALAGEVVARIRAHAAAPPPVP
ncbi:MAG: nuclear transport factor 2 family protein [Acidobacteria bacterium]|nr:nuclear transport factor 2 family protein [Thermoanaerobaculia bacterium]MDI9631105.1 nuclear transport factor 2 family protein [Acidobacteriota bacterium]MBP7812149.1 nuclear transport factor 2 family protein [Thermoanaerobaculia bacterium]MBP8846140.1 nuclear transport factor 2 family protein [Thermoanaerobaculia bacterium]NLN10569.1 nuclear transport factor 2 family protein [Acidobacteriota bacterium]